MGRYYSGDINGKFWFGVQDSTAADRFGVTYCEPQYVDYYFQEENLPKVKREIKRIEEGLGDKLQVIKDFFEKKDSYIESELEDLGICRMELSEYADLLLGIKIRDCLIKNGDCSFTAEL
jgi:hypothetical protein